jgi:hypothetical protein
VRTWIRDQSLSLFFLGLFLLALVGQSLAGWKSFNEEQMQHGSAAISYARYLVSSDFGQAVTENWQSEYLQFVTFIMATIWLVQRGSAESKQVRAKGWESDEKQKVGSRVQSDAPTWARVGGWRTTLYSNSLVLVMLMIFFGSWFAQSATGWTEYNAEQRDHGQPTVSWGGYVMRPNFWENTLQNWQSEFLAVGTMAVFTIYLRQRGSPESKPVGAPHEETGGSQ